MYYLITFLSIAFAIIQVNAVTAQQGLNDLDSEEVTKDSIAWAVYQHVVCDLEIPDTWNVDTTGMMGTKFILFSPLTNGEDVFRENINLIVQDLSGLDLDLDEFVKISENQLSKVISDAVIVNSERVSQEPHEFQSCTFTGTQGIFNLTFKQQYWVFGDKAYVLTFTAESDQYENYKLIAQHSFSSFLFND